ncbi:MAG: potassium-transporting ATPase subunit KdpC [Propionicimonas sp.]|nr:potassium-transporting ATPase subunit KdpC [Propionicimonas sp.]
MNLFRHALAGLRLLAVFTILLGVAYPLAITAVGVGLPAQASGSLLTRDGTVVGSALLGQSFDGPGWFHSRPSAAGDGYDALASGGSNLGPSNPDLVAAIGERRARIAAEEGVAPADVPPDALTASASGLDPHISVAYADLQVARVARTRGLAVAEVAALVVAHTAGPDLGFLGRPRVNVLQLNLAVEAMAGE